MVTCGFKRIAFPIIGKPIPINKAETAALMVTKNQMNTTVENRRFRTRSPFGWGVVALIAILAILVVGGLAFGAARAASAPAAVGYPYYGFFPFGFIFFPFGFIFFFFIVFAVFRFLFWGWGWGGRYRWYGHYWGGPAEILKERYARGEITKEQFEQMMRDLEQHK